MSLFKSTTLSKGMQIKNKHKQNQTRGSNAQAKQIFHASVFQPFGSRGAPSKKSVVKENVA